MSLPVSTQMRKRKTLPTFRTVEEESDFWDKHSPTEFELREVSVAEVVAGGKRSPKQRTVALHVDKNVAAKLRARANQLGINPEKLASELLKKGLAATR